MTRPNDKSYDELDPNSEIDSNEISRRDKERADAHWRDKAKEDKKMNERFDEIRREINKGK